MGGDYGVMRGEMEAGCRIADEVRSGTKRMRSKPVVRWGKRSLRRPVSRPEQRPSVSVSSFLSLIKGGW
jgi:hypothetical protein